MSAAPRDQIGFVVIGRNEGERVVMCLRSILSGVGPTAADRTIYVDSSSTDGSPEAAERLGIAVIRLDDALPLTAARARNEGFAALQGLPSTVRFIQFVDGDCELVQGWCETGSAFLAGQNDVAVVYGRLRERDRDASVYNKLCEIEWNAASAGESIACGGIALIRAEAFKAASGFRAHLPSGEEPELCVRLREGGWKIWRLETEMAIHDAAISRFGQWWARMVRNGAGAMQVSRLHRHSPYGIWKKETKRAILWGGLLPLGIAAGSIVQPLTLFALLIYPAQIVRIAFNRGVGEPLSWTYAFFMTIGKFAEFQGILKFCWRRIVGGSS